MNARTYAFGSSRLTLQFGDIITSKAEVLVSSDDGMLTMGGGVSRAIRRAAGEAVAIDAAKHIPARLGEVVATSAGALPAKYVFHAITIAAGTERMDPRDIIRATTRRCIQLADELGLSSIALPTIGTGAARFSYEDAAVAMSSALAAEFRSRVRAMDATIYLFDRFGERQPMDYVRFFELFSAHSVEFVKLAPPAAEPVPAPTVQDRAVQARAGEQQERSAQLAALSQEREELERQLVDWEGGLSPARAQQIQKRLGEIHQERLEVLTKLQPQSKGVPLFISYSHLDENLRIQLGNHLTPLEHRGLITAWQDRMITPGDEWAEVIDDKICEAGVILLLVSSDFMASKYCIQNEMKRALERHQAGECTVIPVILRSVLWKSMPFAGLQALPKDGKPVAAWPDADSALMNVAEGVEAAIETLLARQGRTQAAL
jgi:O-acetyl-ADP-ribose deacetylase (regulator of RNase III)